MRRWLSLLILFACAASLFAAAKTETRLVLSADTAKPGDTVWAGLEMKMPLGWHTYWQNGGDAGSPTTIAWTLPPGITAGPIAWPIPQKNTNQIGDTVLLTYVYEDEVLLLIPLQLAKDAPAGPKHLEAVVKWQECSDICIIGKSTIQADLTIGDQTKPSTESDLIATWRKKVPPPIAPNAARAYWDEPTNAEARPFIIEWDAQTKTPDFFPYENKNFEVQGPTEILKGDKLRLRKSIKKSEGEWPASVVGILVSDKDSAVEVTLPLTALPVGQKASAIETVAANVPPSASLITMLLFAFIGGLILNVMPCVLPVIALKILGFVNQSKEHPRRVRQLGLVYGLGVLASFLVLAILAIAVQHAGGLAGWGSAFRNPQFRIVITILITLVALNLFGIFEVTLGGGALGAATNLSSKQGFPGAFFNGVLATVLATPCTAPFLGAALTFAFTQTPAIILLIFITIGLGLALPFVVFCWSPNLLKFLPKPGLWMEQFKIAMGFPMLATALWLMSFAAKGEDGVLMMGLFLIVLALAAWIWGQFVQRGRQRKGLAAVSAIVLIALGCYFLLNTTKSEIEWKPWSAEAVQQARQAGHSVIVDFTAKSCLNCKLNKRTSLEIPQTETKLKSISAVAFIGDYTDENPAIAQELQRYGRGGVPLVLIFPKDPAKPAIVLPPILTPAIVQNALDEATR